MTTIRTFTRAALGLGLATIAFAAVGADAVGTDATCAAPVYSQTQLRILDRASQGPDTLRRYVGIVQPIRQTGYVETVEWIDGERDRLAACRMAALRQTTARR